MKKRVSALLVGIMFAASLLPIHAAAEDAAVSTAAPQVSVTAPAQATFVPELSGTEASAAAVTAAPSADAEAGSELSATPADTTPSPTEPPLYNNAPPLYRDPVSVPMPMSLSTVYLNGASGNNSLDGSSAANAVKTMEQALNLVAPGGEIIITGTVKVPGDTTWNGNGVTVKRDPGFTGRMIQLSASNAELAINDMNFDGQNVTAQTGSLGAVLFSDGGNSKLTLDHCSFQDTVGGGAIFTANGKNVTLTITDSNFDHCTTAGSGGAIWTYNVPGSTSSISGTTFQNCTATGNGGAIWARGDLNLTDCTLDSCASTTGGGGGIHFDNDGAGGVLTIQGGALTNCNASPTGTSGRGGAINAGQTRTTLNISDCLLSNNTSSNSGGAIYSGSVNLTNCTLRDNASSLTAGAVTTNGFASTMKDCVFDGNHAVSGGGAILTNRVGPLTLEGCTLTNNWTQTGEGGAILIQRYEGAAPIVHIKDTSITGNQCGAGALGGGIGVTVGDVQLCVSGSVVVNGNVNGSNQAANVSNSNNNAASTAYKVTVEGALSSDSMIGINTKVNAPNILCAVGGNGYTLSETSDLQYFVHDRVTRGDPADALHIVYQASNSTYVLGGYRYLVEHWLEQSSPTDYAEELSLRGEFVGLPGEKPAKTYPDSVKDLDIYGYQYQKTEYEFAADGNAIPQNNNMIVKLYYNKLSYSVSFATEDANRGTVNNGNPQTVDYLGNASAGVTTTTHDTDWFFTGWNYTMDGPDGPGSVTGTIYDYTQLPITGNVTFTATFAKQPFVSISTTGNGSVSIVDGTTPEEIPNGQTQDRYAWQDNASSPYQGAGAFRAEEHFSVSKVTVVLPDSGASYDLDLTRTDAQSLGFGTTATLTLNADKTYGTVLLDGVEKAASVIVTFEEDPQYTVTFDANDGTGSIYATKEGLYLDDPYGPQPAGVPIRAGYVFLGWTTDPDADPEAPANDRANYDPGKRVAVADDAADGQTDQNITYYALWQEVNGREFTYVVEIYLQQPDGSYVQSRVNTVAIYSDTGKLVTEIPPVYTGYLYNDGLSNKTGTVTEIPTLELKLYYDLQKHTVSYYDSATASTPSDTAEYLYGVAVPTPTPTRPGYVFEGFYTDTDYVHSFADGTAMPEHDVNLYAKWVPVPYTVNYDTNGATSPAIKPETNIHWDDAGLLPSVTPTRPGFVFAGWVLNGTPIDGTFTYAQLVALLGGDETMMQITLLALWQPNPAAPTVTPTVVTAAAAPSLAPTAAPVVIPQTGDSFHPQLWLMLALCSGTAFVLMLQGRKRFWRFLRRAMWNG